ncbi:MAG: hypothetical protein GF329_17500 [Candidatus Lokiarchaeota archaeon]|nr:hypothetical protein [Candidatus Lokiarchaeota archaeon]
MSIILYGGVNQIGGNKILIKDSGESLLFDFGLSFSDRAKFFNDFLNPRSVNGIGDYLYFKLIPDIPGLYREDLSRPICYPTTEEKPVDSIFISHAHVDHFGLISFIREDIPVYASSITNKIIKSYEDVVRSGIEKEFTNLKYRPYGEYIYHSKWEKLTRTFNNWKEYKGDIDIKFFNLDHSVWGAGGYIIDTSNRRIVFTGDFRQHGPRSHLTKDSMKNLEGDDIDVLIIEGTNIGEEDVDIKTLLIIEDFMGKKRGKKLPSEEELKQEAFKIVNSTKKPIFIDFGLRDFDRFKTFLSIAKRCDREFVIPIKLAKHIQDLSDELDIDIQDDTISIYQEPKYLGAYNPKEYYKWERGFLEFENIKTSEDIKENMNKSIIYIDYYHLKNLIDLKPENGIYIHSTTEPFDEEQAIDFRRHLEWIKFFGLEYHYLHTSGHARKDEIFKIIKNLDPKQIIPIHTLGSKIFEKNFQNVLIPKIGKQI